MTYYYIPVCSGDQSDHYNYRFSPGLMATQSPRSPGYEVVFEADHAISFKNMITRQDVVFNFWKWKRHSLTKNSIGNNKRMF